MMLFLAGDECTKDAVLASFDPSYHAAMAKLPDFLWPQSTVHGKHSYTVLLGSQPAAH